MKNIFVIVLIGFLLIGRNGLSYAGQIRKNTSLRVSMNMDHVSKKVIIVALSEFDTCTNITGSVPSEEGVLISKDRVSGFEVDLLETIVQKAGWKTNYVYYSFSEKMKAVIRGDVDMGIGCISMTSERNKQLVYSRYTMKSGLVALSRKSPWWWESMKPITLQLGLTYFVAFQSYSLLIFLLSRWENKNSPIKSWGDAKIAIKSRLNIGRETKNYPTGFWSGITFDVVLPLCLVLFIIGVIKAENDLASERAEISIRNAHELANYKVATKAGTFSYRFLIEYGVETIAVVDVSEAFEMLHSGCNQVVHKRL